MRSLRFHGAGDLRIDEVPEPGSSLAPHDVLIRSVLAGICGTDLHEYRRGPLVTTRVQHPVTGDMEPPALGHEVSGVVIAIGSEVTNVAEGDRVAVMPRRVCGVCAQCRSRSQHLCRASTCIGVRSPWGGFGERLVVDEQQATTLPDNMTLAQGAIIEPAAVALHAVTRSGVTPGDVGLVTGGGPIGLLAAFGLRLAGASSVAISEPNERRRSAAAALGFEVIDPTESDVRTWVADRTGGAGADVAVECSGHVAAIDAAIGALRSAGTLVQVASSAGPVAFDLATVVVREIDLRGSFCYPIDSWPRIVRLVSEGALPVERLITSEVSLDDAVKGFEDLLDPESEQLKILVRIGTD
jgi:(R,R)-butanediol dehydrogenase/meso-butanediol dehydrogenase/diacetyl reductase